MAAIGFSIGNYGYVGTGNSGSPSGEFWEYNPASDTWTEKDSLKLPRTSAMGFSIGDKGYIGGGFNYDTSSTYYSDFWEYTTSYVKIDEIGNINDQTIIYPNPNKGTVQIKYSPFQKNKVDLILSDVCGNAIGVFTIRNEVNTLNLDPLKDGIYFYRIMDNLTTLASGKIVIVR